MSRAAEELCVTQPTLTKTIRRMEAELGVPLFWHVGRNIEISPYGEVVLKYAGEVIDALDGMKAEINEMRAVSEHKITVAMNCIMFVLPYVIGEFVREYPDIQADIIRGEERDYDINIFSSGQLQEKGMLLMQEECKICMAADSPLAQKEILMPQDFENAEFIVTGLNHAMCRILRQYCEENRIKLNIKAECDSVSGVLAMVETKAGVSLVPMKTWDFGRFPNIVFKNVACGAIHRYVYAKAREGSYETYAMRMFMEFLKNNFERIFQSKI